MDFALGNGIYGELEGDAALTEELLDQVKEQMHVLVAVSYTHLDVYKRQSSQSRKTLSFVPHYLRIQKGWREKALPPP